MPNGGYGNTYDLPTASLPVNNSSSLPAKTQILPAAGDRSATTGAIAQQGIAGHYWPNTPQSSTQGHLFWFSSSGAYPATATSSVRGFNIRCVRI
jgi:hypothetical protein